MGENPIECLFAAEARLRAAAREYVKESNEQARKELRIAARNFCAAEDVIHVCIAEGA